MFIVADLASLINLLFLGLSVHFFSIHFDGEEPVTLIVLSSSCRCLPPVAKHAVHSTAMDLLLLI